MTDTTRQGYEWWDRLCALPTYSFLLGPGGNSIRRVEDKGGNWVERSAAQVVVDSAQTEINALRQALSDWAAPSADRTCEHGCNGCENCVDDDQSAAALWREHVAKLDALVTYCPTCCQGSSASKDMTRDEIIFECGKTVGRSTPAAKPAEGSNAE